MQLQLQSPYMRMSLLPPSRFTAKSDFNLWFMRFELYTEISDGERVKELLPLLDGELFRAVNQMGLIGSTEYSVLTWGRLFEAPWLCDRSLNTPLVGLGGGGGRWGKLYVPLQSLTGCQKHSLSITFGNGNCCNIIYLSNMKSKYRYN